MRTFVEKLFEMVSDWQTNHLIAWNEEGDAFEVFHILDFEATVLPLYFKHSHMSSFVRQLNSYGFLKVRRSNRASGSVFSHPSFSREGRAALSSISRGKRPSTKAKTIQSQLVTESPANPPKMIQLLGTFQQLLAAEEKLQQLTNALEDAKTALLEQSTATISYSPDLCWEGSPERDSHSAPSHQTET